jgi:hypothetical protein
MGSVKMRGVNKVDYPMKLRVFLLCSNPESLINNSDVECALLLPPVSTAIPR